MLTRDDGREIMNLIEWFNQQQTGREGQPKSMMVRLEDMTESIFRGMGAIIEDLTLAQRLISANNMKAKLDTIGDDDVPERGEEYTKARWRLLNIVNTSFWTWLNTPLATPTGEPLPPPIAIFSMEYVKPDPTITPPAPAPTQPAPTEPAPAPTEPAPAPAAAPATTSRKAPRKDTQ